MADVKFIKLNDNALVPTYGTQFSAGADIYALIDTESVSIAAGETVLIHTGIALQIPEGIGGFIFARSGLASKKGLAPANKVGVIDSDYRGEIMVALHNHSNEIRTVDDKERIAQIVFLPYEKANFILSESLDETKRDVGGFGSTGRK